MEWRRRRPTDRYGMVWYDMASVFFFFVSRCSLLLLLELERGEIPVQRPVGWVGLETPRDKVMRCFTLTNLWGDRASFASLIRWWWSKDIQDGWVGGSFFFFFFDGMVR